MDGATALALHGDADVDMAALVFDAFAHNVGGSGVVRPQRCRQVFSFEAGSLGQTGGQSTFMHEYVPLTRFGVGMKGRKANAIPLPDNSTPGGGEEG